MCANLPESQPPGPSLEAHLLGRIEFGRALALQQRVVEAIAGRSDGQACLLLCEHPAIITIGRGGSPAEVRLESGVLKSRQLEVRWVKRGGGSMVHVPGQLAVYPIVPLWWHRFSVGEYLDRLQAAILDTLEHLGTPGQTRAGRHGIFGRSGQLVAFGAAVRHETTFHGAFINVCPAMGLFRRVDTDPQDFTPMSSLAAERQKPVKMTALRAELVPRLCDALECDRYHLYTGHPSLRRSRGGEVTGDEIQSESL